MIRSFLTVGFWTALSRILGLIREILMSHIVGASVIADAFIVAFKFPNFFRRFFAEGAFNSAFVPFLNHSLASEGLEKSKVSVNRIFSALFFFLAFFTVVVLFLTPFLMPFLAPGFCSTPERFSLAVFFTRITFPYILLISLSALLSGVLNSLYRFSAGAAAPIILNVFMIGALLWAGHSVLSPGLLLSLSVTLAGCVQLGWLLFMVKRSGFHIRLTRHFQSPEVKVVLKRMIPGMVGSGVMQINLLIDMILASLLPTGALSYLYYADRLNQLPLSIFGIAIGTVLLPPLSKHWKQKELSQMHALQQKALGMSLQFTIPASIGLMVLSYPLIGLIFGHGHFSSSDVEATAPTLMALAFGLPAYVSSKVFATSFFSTGDTKTPVRFSFYSVIINIGLNLILMKPLKHIGLALGTSLSAWVYAFLLGKHLYQNNFFELNRSLVLILGKVTLASFIMGGTLICFQKFYPFAVHSFYGELFSTLSLIFLGLVVYGLVAWKFKIVPWLWHPSHS